MKLKNLSAALTNKVAAVTATFNAVDEFGNEIEGAAFTLRSPQSEEVVKVGERHDVERSKFLLKWGDPARLKGAALTEYLAELTTQTNRQFAERMRAAFVSAHPTLTGDDGSTLTAEDFYTVMLRREGDDDEARRDRELQRQVAVWYADLRTFRPLASRAVATPAPTSPLPQTAQASGISPDTPVASSN